MAQVFPIVKARLNDKVAWFIVDTGASITLLNQAESKYFGFGKRNYLSDTETEINGLGGSIAIIETSRCTIEVGHLIIKHYGLKSRDMSELFSVIKSNEKIIIAGVLGSDILSKYRINVNYDNSTLSYKIKN